MRKTSKIISIILTVIMLMGLMTTATFAAQTLPTTFGWSTENAGYITIDVPEFDGEEVEYPLDLYKDGKLVDVVYYAIFEESGEQECDIFTRKINELGNGTYKYKIGLSRNDDTLELENPTAFSSEYVKSSGTNTPPTTPDDDNTSGTPIDRSSVSEEYYDAAKVMYDLGIMPDIYTKCKDNMTNGEAAVVLTKLLGSYDMAMSLKDLSLYPNAEVGTEINGCINYLIYNNIIDNRSTYDPSEQVVYSDIVASLVDVLGYAPVVERKGGKPYGSLVVASSKGLTKGMSVALNSKMTYEQVSQLIYNSLFIGIMEQTGWSISGDNSYEETDKTILTKYLDIAKITANITVNGNTASISGMKYDKDNLKGIEISNVSAEIADSDILEYADGGLLLFVKDNKILSGLEYTDAYFIVNNGEPETENTTVSIKLFAYGYTKYKFIVGDESDADIPYTPITSNVVSHTISNVDGNHNIQIKFANDDESLTKVTSRSITLNNKQNITFMANGSVIKTEEQGCGKRITFPDVNIDGYWVKGWSVPADYIIPDKDITVTANLIPLATIEGKIIDSNNEPVERATVSLNAYKDYGNNGSVSAYTDADGRFEIIYPQGEYLLSIYRYSPYMTVEVNANQSIVDLGDIKLASIVPYVSAQNQVETTKGLTAIIDNIFTDEEKSLIPEGGTYTLSCSAGATPVVSDDQDIAKAINDDYSDNTAIYYFDISMSKVLKNEVGSYVSSIDVYEIPELLEFVINIPAELQEKDKYVIYREHTVQAENDTEKVIEKITEEANEFGEYLTVKDNKIRLFVKRFSTYGIVGIDEDKPEQPTHRPTGGGGSSSTTVSVPTSTGTDVKATVSGTTATISKIDTSKVSEETSYAIDMSGAKKTIKSVKLPTSVVKDLAKEDSTVETLDIKLSSGSASFDAEALKTISEDAKGSQITLNIDNATAKLTNTENNAIKDISSPTVVEVSLLSNNKTISDFKGGKAVVSVPYELKEGQIAESVIAQHIGENGILTEMKTLYDEKTNTVSFVAPHFSKYVISAIYEKDAIVLNIGQKDAKVFGETVSNDVAPKIVNERTMLPIRFIAEKLGASVDWVQESQTVIVELDDIKISLVIGENFATVNDEKVELDSPSFVEDDRTFLPIRFVMENLGADVLWNGETQTVIITK